VAFTSTHTGRGYHHILKVAIEQKRIWITERGLHSKPIMSNELQVFFNELAQNGKTLTTVGSQMTAGKRNISFEISLRYRKHHFGYITAHDSTLTDASPGRLHMDFSQRDAINQGMQAFDLMVPADPHKKTWSSNAVRTCGYFTHLNTRGAIYTALYLKTFRPMLRWLYLKAPASVRRHITRFTS
jgi:CelD/BcsL family acetyltransferase involved in cellulose biosynthesis